MKTIGAAIVGGTGFGAGELLRYFVSHPAVEVVSVVSSSSPGERISGSHPYLSSFYDRPFDAALPFERLEPYRERFIFLALPHGQSGLWLKEHRAKLGRTKLIDLSADYRLSVQAVHEQTYPEVPFDGEIRSQFCYGLSEAASEQIARSHWIANPGCLATACALAAKPLLSAFSSELSGTLCFDAKTGTSGAGRKAQDSMHHPTRHANMEAYKVLCHRHEPELRQALGLSAAQRTMFVPHLLPCTRGIFVTVYTELKSPQSASDLLDCYQRFYQGKRFIRIRETSPTLHDVVGTNFCDIAVAVRGTQVVVMCSLDNMGKGMAGQAIQNMNLMCGLDETSGLLIPSVGPL
ncbi:MAG: N-acetyl-gamma-glutamyl-phosphate reductase [Bdellovibrionota bacterium]|nr:MAG: N-acetyl-gamma-glutamyl-phosphate reductase [Bdellovibrionota bacterium]